MFHIVLLPCAELCLPVFVLGFSVKMAAAAVLALAQGLEQITSDIKHMAAVRKE